MAGLLGNPRAARIGLLAPQRASAGSMDWYRSILGGGPAAPMTADTYESGTYDAGDEQLLRSQMAREAASVAPPMAERAPAPAPMSAPRGAPARDRVSGWRVFDRVLGGQTVTQGLDAERARLEAEAQRPQLLARQARIQSYVDTLPPELQLAFAANPEELGKAFSTRAEGRVLDQGDVYLSGETPGYAAPFEVAPGSSVFNPLNPGAPISVAPQENKVAGGALVDPTGRVLYRGPQVNGVAAGSDAYITPEIVAGAGGGAPVIDRAARPETVNLAPGAEVVTLDANGNPVNRVSSQTARPMSDADQGAVAKAEANVARIDTAISRAQAIRQQLDSGELNLGPVTNFLGGIRNATGNSDANSLNYDSLRNWAGQARQAILETANGVQTEGDALRALELILSNPNDERVVRQALERYIEAQAPIRTVYQRDIARRSGGQGAENGIVTVNSPQEAQALPPGTQFRTPDGQLRVRQ